MRKKWNKVVDGISEEDFVVKKISSGIHPVDILKELNNLYKNDRNTGMVEKLFKRRTGKNISEFASHPRNINFNGDIPPEILYPQLESLSARNEIYSQFGKDKHNKILFISDIEIPFQNNEYIIKVIDFAKEEGCTDLCFGGDFFHEYSMSKYAKDKNISLDDEWKVGNKIAEYIKDKFNKIVFIMGNHDYRVMMWLKYTMRGGFGGVKCILKNDRGDLLQALCEKHEFLYSKDWWCQIGEVIVAHQFPYSTVWGRNPTNSVDWFIARMPKGMDSSWAKEDSLHIRPFKGLVQGHSHRIFSGGIYKQIYMYENGCLCNEIDFNVKGNRTQPVWERGFAIITLKNNKILYNESRVYKCDEL